MRLALQMPTQMGFDLARREVLKWVQNRAGDRLPSGAWEGEPFERLAAGRTIMAVRIEANDAEVWSVRMDDPDKFVAGRSWSTEITLGRNAHEKPQVGLRLLASSGEQELDVQPAVPGVVRQITDVCGLLDGPHPVSSVPLAVGTVEDIQQLVSLLASPLRQLPVIIASGDERALDQTSPLVDVHALAKALAGLAHIVALPANFTYDLSDEVGKSLSAFYGAVRIYNPGFDYWADPFSHRLFLPEMVRRDPLHVANEIRLRVAHDSLGRVRLGQHVVPFADVRLAALRKEQRDQSDHEVSDSDQLNTANKQIEALEEDREKLRSEVDQSLDMASAESERAEVAESQLNAAIARIASLEGALKARDVEPDAAITAPTDWSEFADWCEANFVGRLRLEAAARKGVKKPAFQDIPQAAEAVIWLATEGRDRFISGGGSMANIPIGKGLHNAPCGADEFTTYSQGKPVSINWHIKNGGNTRQPERCLRIYYGFDPYTQQIIIADMPHHRDSGAT